ncbi:MAG TPA: 3-deoxy-7-phosphoheptulonate synthase [Pseudomonadales bacterium]|nr:3-deoxy-7-phosphoheptulonate synthase [Pseudomonadales bacterium]
MKFLTDDIRITGMEEVIAPEQLLRDLPIPDSASRLIFDARRRAADIIHGRDDRLIVVIGPCSIHDPAAAHEYAGRLKEAARRHERDLQLIMRVYFEKPRTTVGWKGLINDPGLDESYDINRGLHVARQVLLDVAATGLPAGTEYLDPISPQYIGDLVSWAAIGARTTESQVHRQLASGLSCPVGFKNSTNGDVQVAVDAVKSADHPHIFMSVTKAGHSAIFSTSGNDDCHVILRGGAEGPNYDAAHVASTRALLEKAGLDRGIMVDFSHANSRKQHDLQLEVSTDIARQVADGDHGLVGVMVESNLVAGRQSAEPGAELLYGQSITDACIDWSDSEQILAQLAEAVRTRRA